MNTEARGAAVEISNRCPPVAPGRDGGGRSQGNFAAVIGDFAAAGPLPDSLVEKKHSSSSVRRVDREVFAWVEVVADAVQRVVADRCDLAAVRVGASPVQDPVGDPCAAALSHPTRATCSIRPSGGRVRSAMRRSSATSSNGT